MAADISTTPRTGHARFSSTNQPARRGRGIARVGPGRVPANNVVVTTECSFYWTEQGGPPQADNSPMIACHKCGVFTPRPVVAMRYGVGLSTDRVAMTINRTHGGMMADRQRLIDGGATAVVIAMVGYCPECDIDEPDTIASPPTQLDYRMRPATLSHLK